MGGADIQSSVAVSDNIGVMLNGTILASSKKGNDDEEIISDSRYGEIALGYFKKFEDNKVMELYLGSGLGYTRSKNFFSPFRTDKIDGKSNYYKIFAQSNAGFKADFVEAGIGIRLSYVDFYKITYDNSDINDSASSFFIEPVFFVKFGGPYFKFQAQFGAPKKIGGNEFVGYMPVILGIGVNLTIPSVF